MTWPSVVQLEGHINFGNVLAARPGPRVQATKKMNKFNYLSRSRGREGFERRFTQGHFNQDS
jgi:hypothetical protein